MKYLLPNYKETISAILAIILIITCYICYKKGYKKGFETQQSFIDYQNYKLGFKQGAYWSFKTRNIDYWRYGYEIFIQSNFSDWSNWTADIGRD